MFQKSVCALLFMQGSVRKLFYLVYNLVNNKIAVERFKKNPEIEAVDILLQERMPEKAIITKENKDTLHNKYKTHQVYNPFNFLCW